MTVKLPLDYTITHRYEDVDISERDFQSLLNIATWNDVTPKFARPGRVAWHVLSNPITMKSDPSRVYKAAKLKGVGLWNPKLPGRFSGILSDDYSDDPVTPLTEVWKDLLTYPHMGLDQEGEYRLAYSAPCPIGGILHDRAHLEYWAGERLLAAGVPTIAPVAVLKYGEALQFEGRAMGAAITLSTEPSFYRISEALYGAAVTRGKNPEADAYYDRMRESLDVGGDPEDEKSRLQLINLLARQEGHLIREFSMAGLYRYSGDWSNFHYCVDRKELFLIDLDSVQDMNNTPEHLRPMQAWRDLCTTVYRMMAKFAYPTALDKYTLRNVLDYDPMSELLLGYFDGRHEKAIRQISRRLWNAFIPYLFLLKKHKDAIRNEWVGPRRKTYKMDHDLFYVMAFTSLRPLFMESVIQTKYPSTLTHEDMMGKAERFLGERYEFFQYLMDEMA